MGARIGSYRKFASGIELDCCPYSTRAVEVLHGAVSLGLV